MIDGVAVATPFCLNDLGKDLNMTRIDISQKQKKEIITL